MCLKFQSILTLTLSAKASRGPDFLKMMSVAYRHLAQKLINTEFINPNLTEMCMIYFLCEGWKCQKALSGWDSMLLSIGRRWIFDGIKSNYKLYFLMFFFPLSLLRVFNENRRKIHFQNGIFQPPREHNYFFL